MPDGDDEITPFSTHLDELRKRLIWSLVGLFIAFTVVFSFFADDIVRYIIQIAAKIRFSVINPLETFSTTMRVSLYAALVISYPWVMLQAYLFIAPGLYRHERNFFRFAIPTFFLLFVGGAAFGRYVLLPISIPFLLSFNVSEFGVQENYTLGAYLSLIFAMTFGLGFVFQIPLIVAPLIRFGLLSPEFFRKKRRYTVLVSLVIGAVISPTGSPIDMLLAGAPVFLLVEGGVWFGKLWKRSALKRAEKEAREAAERGEKIDPEALAGGLAVDLEKKLGEFSKGGARKFARELVGGLRESGKDIETIFDDNYKDTDKPPVEVKLKKRPPKPEPAASAAGQPASPKADTVSPDLTTTAASSPAANAKQGTRNPEQEFPDRPWDENVTEPLARYIEDRISQRLEQYFERELRPWMDRIEHELKNRNGDHK
jgi:sec-independent protein translocase protein TatC